MGYRPTHKKRKERSIPNHLKEIDQAKARQQKLYHYEKQLHKAVKKAKEFEIRKISRRLKQAADGQAKDGGASGGQAAAAQKLQQQLDAVKALGLDGLTKEAAASLVGGTNGKSEGRQPAEPQEMHAVALVRARILSAKCVQETLAAAREALARLEAAAEPQEAESEGAEPDLAAGPEPAVHAPDAASPGSEASQGEFSGAASASDSELSEDEAEMVAKRRKLLGSSGEAAQKQQPKPPPKKKKKNRLGQRARKLLAGAPIGGTQSAQSARPGARPQQGKPTRQTGRSVHPPAAAPVSVKGAQPASVKQRPAAKVPAQPKGELKAQEAAQGEIHPSWAAKKALADKGGLMAPSQGTKIVFGEND